MSNGPDFDDQEDDWFDNECDGDITDY